MHNKTRNRGLAFVTMGSPEEALTALNNLESYGRTLKVNYAKPKKKNPPPPVWPKPITFNLFVANLSFEARAKDVKEFFISEGCNIVFAEVFFTIIHEGHLVMALYPLKPRKNLTLPFQLLKGRFNMNSGPAYSALALEKPPNF
ncbi:hypothetical protein QYF36_021181 [Acer negundo]|nr:hypothetical protein QYF36_021181 [Acer negundo]